MTRQHSTYITDADEEWQNYTSLQDRVLHIQLRNWADLCLIAPLSAHTLAKMANGLCDDLLSCSFRAWDFGQRHSSLGSGGGVGCGGSSGSGRRGKPVILAPAMNTAMWDHPLTRKQLESIQGFNKLTQQSKSVSSTCKEEVDTVTIVQPAVKTLACGEVGAGALADLDDILLAVTSCMVQWKIIADESLVTTTDENVSG